MQNNTIKIVDYLDGFQTEARGSRIPVGAKATQTKNNEQYAGGILQFFPTSEGYVAATESNEIANPYLYNYVYNYTDHLGNIRLSYTKDPISGDLEIMEETEERGSRTPNKRRSHKTNDSEQNHYYPFGLKHAVYADPKQMYKLDEEEENLARPAYVYETEYQYKFGGKELQDELNLNLYDYGARNYDAALGRWMNVDPLTEVSRKFSPNAYALNNPVYFIDPDGMLAEGFGLDTDYKLSQNGSIERVDPNDGTENDPTDTLYATDTDGNVDQNNSITLRKGSIKYS